MNKKTRKLFAWCLVVAMLITQMLFTNIAFAATDSYKGNDRFSTAFSIVDKGWTTSDVAVIARGDVDGSDLADALAAAPLAYANGKAPVFITQKDVLTDGIMQRLTALGVKKVFIVGGTGAVSQAVEDTLAAKLGAANVTRVSGASRVETSLAVAKLVAPTPTKVVLVNGYASADALSAAPLAAAQGMPVLFVENKDTLSDAVKAYIGTAKVYVVGGTGVVSDAVKTAVSGERVAGDDRFATNNAVLTTFAPDYTKVYLAKGADANAIDALAGAPLAALTNSPIVFVDDQGSVISAKASLAKNLLANSTIIGLGGLVTNDVLAFVDALRPAAVNVDSVSKITVSVNNPVSADYTDTVFLGTLGQITAKAVDKNGNPVANVPIVFQGKDITYIYDGEDADFVQPVAYTNADGIAVGFVKATENTEAGRVASEITDGARTLTYVASVVGKNVTPVEGKIRFASLSVGTVSVVGPKIDTNSDGTPDTLDITPKKGAPSDYEIPMVTSNMNGLSTSYVASQQVSTTGKTEHALTFSVKPTMVYIKDGATATVGTYLQDLSKEPKLGAYHPYDELKSKDFEIPVGLKYATIYLKNLQLDENARVYVNFYSDGSFVDDVVLQGPINDTNRGVQIPQNIINSIDSFNVVLKTAGQVNTTLNGGVELDRVEGVFKTAAGTGSGTSVAIPGSKITWSAASVVYSETMKMEKGNHPESLVKDAKVYAGDYGINVANADRYDYKVPVFPFTGDAVVSAYDKNNKVLAYYLIPTRNVNNKNVLKTGINAVLSSKSEVTNTVGTVTANTDGTQVTVNSEKVGSTLVKGVIDIPGVPTEVLDATNATVYTSVNWAPLPKAGTTEDVEANSKLFALQGQRVNVVAQLVDRNGNAATEEGQTVILDGTIPTNVGVSPTTKVTAGEDAGKYAATTDTNGQVKWTLSSSTLNKITGLEATNENYDVVLQIGDVTVSKADIYWIGAQLTHKPDLDTAEMTGAQAAAAKYQAKYNVGDPVEFGFMANGKVATTTVAGVEVPTWDVTSVTLSGIPVNFTKVSGTVGSIDKVADKPYAILAKSDRAGVESVNAKIGTMSSANVKVVYTVDGDDYDGAFVGVGTSSITDSFKLNIAWQSEGAQFNIIAPSGEVATTDTTVYVKLTDNLGNPLKGEEITAYVDSVEVTGLALSDLNGVVEIPVDKPADKSNSTVKVEYNGEVQYFNINWNDAKDFGMVSAGVNTTGTNDVVTVSFNNDVNPNSVIAKQFKISNGTTVYGVKSFEVDGNQVKLTLADSNAHLFTNGVQTTFTVEYDPYTDFTGDYAGIEFNLVDVDGNPVADTYNTATFVTPSNVIVGEISYDDATENLSVAYDNANGLAVYVVDANGVITTSATGTLSGTGTATIHVDKDASSCIVYVNGIGTVINW